MKKILNLIYVFVFAVSISSCAKAESYKSTLEADAYASYSYFDSKDILNWTANYPAGVTPEWFSDENKLGFEVISYYKFKLPTIPDNEVVTGATFKAYTFSNSTETASANLYPISFDDWSENKGFFLKDGKHFSDNDFHLNTELAASPLTFLQEWSWEYNPAKLSKENIDFMETISSDGYLSFAISGIVPGTPGAFFDEDFISKNYNSPLDSDWDSEEISFWNTHVIPSNNAYIAQLNIETTPVPEPTSIALGFMGVASLFGINRKK